MRARRSSRCTGARSTSAVATASAGVNTLTSPAFDADSLQPELKFAAVRIEKVELPSRFVAFAWLDGATLEATRERLHRCFARFAYASCVPFGRIDGDERRVGLVFRAADAEPIEDASIAFVERELGLVDPHDGSAWLLRYDDPRRAHARRVLVRDGAIAGVALRGDWSAETWLRDYLESAAPVAALGRLLLRPGAVAPSGFKPRGRVVCNCWNVPESMIVETLERLDGTPVERLRALQAGLKCGTQCGSCVPELKRMVGDVRGMVSAS